MPTALYRPSYAPGDSSGYKEQILSDAKSLVDHVDAPLFKGLSNISADQYRVDKITDQLSANTIPTAPLFDADPSYTFTDSRTRTFNYVQEFIKTFLVAEVSQLIAKKGSVAGVPNEADYQLEKRIKELMRNIERVLCSEQTGQPDDDTNPAYMDGFVKTLTTNVTDTGATVGSAFYASITETQFQDRILDVFNQGVEGELWCVAPPAFCMHVARNYTGRVSVVREQQSRSDAKVDMRLETYQAPVGGLVTIKPNRSMGEAVLLISKEYVQIAELRGITVKRTDKDEQHTRGFVNWYGTIINRNEKAHGCWKSDNTPDAPGE